MKCLWCATETTLDRSKETAELKYANREHIFPESVGGEICLETGKVCESCNSRLGIVDQNLRDKNLLMAKKYQDAMHVTGEPLGKVRNKSDKERKLAQKDKISAFDNRTTIDRNGATNIIRINNSPAGMNEWEPHNEQFSRALHKCAVNVLYCDRTFEQMRPYFDDIIEFVNSDHADHRPWPYGICYSHFFSLDSFPLTGFVIDRGDRPVAVVLTFPALVAVVGLFPNALTLTGLQQIGDHILKSTFEEMKVNDFAEKYYIGSMFGGNDSKNKTFGTCYKFRLHKRHIDPEPRQDGHFHLLFRCGVCDQINPSGLWINKEKVLTHLPSHEVTSRSEGWNLITEADLRHQGMQVDLWSKDYLTQNLAQPFKYNAGVSLLDRPELCEIICPCKNCASNFIISGKDLFI